LVATALLTASACQSEVVVGSGCKDGVCPLASGADACVLRTTGREVILGSEADGGEPLRGICLPNALQRGSDDQVEARVLWVLPAVAGTMADAPTHCSDRSFLSAAEGVTSRYLAQQYPGREICTVEQLPVPAKKDGRVPPDGDGFYYDDFSSDLAARCSKLAPRSITFSGLAELPFGVLVAIQTDEMLDTNGEPRGERLCRAAADSSAVGKSCEPTLSEYDVSQAVLQTRVAACGGGACLAYHLEGSLAKDCVAEPLESCQVSDTKCLAKPCAKPAEVAEHAFCTCRCDSPDPTAEVCKCGEGFSCVPTFEVGDPSLVGSYCVPDGIVVTPF
jgi:hypothetical protein